MAELLGTATVRVQADTRRALQEIRQFARQADAQLRTAERSVSRVDTALRGLRASAQAVNVRATIDDQTSPGATAVRAAVLDLQRLGPVRIDARVDVQAADIANTASALRGLKDAARDAARALGTLATRAAAATAALVLLSTQTRDLRGDMDRLDGAIRRAGAGMTALRGNLGTVTLAAGNAGEGMAALASGAQLLAPALIPIAAQALPIAAGLAAATVAVGAFAAAAGGQISAISEASEAEKTYRDAVAEHGAASKQASDASAAYARQMEQLPPATRKAAVALSGLKSSYREWSDSLAASTMPVATKAFQTFGALFPKLTPVVQGAAGQLNRFVTIAAGGVASPGFDRFMQSFAEFSTGAMAKANDALIRFTRTLDTGKVSGGVSEFMEYARANGPLVRDTLAKVATALGNLLEGAANVGPGILTVVNALAGLVAAVPPGVITTMLQLAIALKAVRLAAVGMAAVSGGVAAFGLAITGMQTAAAGATGILPKLAAAIATLSRTAKVALAGTGIGLLVIALSELSNVGKQAPPDVDKMTTSLGRLAQTGKLSGEAARVFGPNFKELGESLRTLSRPSNLDKTQQFLTSLVGMDSTPVKNAKEDFQALDEGLTNLVQGGKPQLAAAALEVAIAKLKKQGFTADEVRAQIDGYKAALADQALEQEFATRAMGIFGRQAQDTSAKLTAQRTAADGLRAAITALNEVNQSAYGAQIQFEGAIDSLTAAFKENGATLDINSEAGRKNGEAMLTAAKSRDELIASGLAAGSSLESMTGKSDKLRGAMLKLATEAFDGNTKKAREYTNELLGTPSQVTTLIKAERGEAIAGLQAVQTAIKKTPGAKSIKVSTLNAAAIKALADVGLKTRQLPDGRTEVFTANGKALGNIGKVSTALGRLDGKTARTYTTNTIRTINEIITRSKTYRSVHDIVGATGGLYTGSGFKYRGKGYADGGMVEGPGTGTSDSIFAPWLSAKEFVVNAKQTAKHLSLLRAINDGRLDGRSPRFTARRAASVPEMDMGRRVNLSRSSTAAPTVIHQYVTVELSNHGVLGSQLEVDNWLTGAMDRLNRTRRLPKFS